MTPAQAQGVYIIFSLAVLLTCLAIAALHLRAWHLRDPLGLDARAESDLLAGARGYGAIGVVAVLAIVVAAFDVGTGWGLPIWLLLVLAPAGDWLLRTHRPLADGGPVDPDGATG